MLKYMKKYKVLRYYGTHSPRYNELILEISKIFHDANIPQNNIDYVIKSLTTDSSPHSTTGKSQRSVYEDVLKAKPYLMEKLVNMYYYDYVIFGFPIPQIY